MRAKLIKLLDVKSIVTIILLGVFCYLAIIQVITAERFYTIFLMVISFYFGTQTIKNTPEV